MSEVPAALPLKPESRVRLSSAKERRQAARLHLDDGANLILLAINCAMSSVFTTEICRMIHWSATCDIKEAIARVEEYTRGISYQELLEDKTTQDAVVRNIEIMGEAAKKISTDFKRKHKDIDWKAIAGTRDKVIHEYFGVNWSILWDVVKNKIPQLKTQLDSAPESSK